MLLISYSNHMIAKDNNIISGAQAINKKYIGVNVRMPEKLYQEIDKLSKIEGHSGSNRGQSLVYLDRVKHTTELLQ